MPDSVRNAVIALWVTIALSAIAALIDRLAGQLTDGMFLFYLIIYALICIIPYKISNGSNAARYVFLVLFIFSILSWIGGSEEMDLPKWSMIASYLITVVDLFIIYWLFTSQSNQWFKKQNNQSKI